MLREEAPVCGRGVLLCAQGGGAPHGTPLRAGAAGTQAPLRTRPQANFPPLRQGQGGMGCCMVFLLGWWCDGCETGDCNARLRLPACLTANSALRGVGRHNGALHFHAFRGCLSASAGWHPQ